LMLQKRIINFSFNYQIKKIKKKRYFRLISINWVWKIQLITFYQLLITFKQKQIIFAIKIRFNSEIKTIFLAKQRLNYYKNYNLNCELFQVNCYQVKNIFKQKFLIKFMIL
ncbi:transmembrane protein, putative, partial (macronuclear) [Tetrahymena thermophila SB210]